jgi:hypothetical protein
MGLGGRGHEAVSKSGIELETRRVQKGKRRRGDFRKDRDCVSPKGQEKEDFTKDRDWETVKEQENGGFTQETPRQRPLLRAFSWPRIYKDVARFLISREVCAAAKPPNEARMGAEGFITILIEPDFTLGCSSQTSGLCFASYENRHLFRQSPEHFQRFAKLTHFPVEKSRPLSINSKEEAFHCYTSNTASRS